jgi:hypothetical protein
VFFRTVRESAQKREDERARLIPRNALRISQLGLY